MVSPPDHLIGPHLFLTFFRWLEATQERRGRLVKAAFFAPRSGRSEAQSLDWPPALSTLASGKMGDHPFPWPPSFSRDAFFLSACCRIARYSATEAQRRVSWSLSRSRATPRLLLLDLVHDPVEPLLRYRLPLRQRTQQVDQPQPARRDLHHLRTGSKACLVLFGLAQHQPADQLRLRLLPLSRQHFQFMQLPLVQLRPHVMHSESRALGRLRCQVLLIEQRHRSTLPTPAFFAQVYTSFPTEPRNTLSIGCQDGSPRALAGFPTVPSQGWSVNILPVRSTVFTPPRN